MCRNGSDHCDLHVVLKSSTARNDYLDFPHVHQVFRIGRSVTLVRSGQRRQEAVFGVTSCPPEEADPSRIGELARGHWEIDTKLHRVRDVVYDEDRSQSRTGRGAQAMAGLRNFSISCLRLGGWGDIDQALRWFASDWRYPLDLLGS